MKVSIILTTYNRVEDCIFCLTRLLRQRTNEVEVILLDDFHFSSKKLLDFCTQNGVKYIHTGIQKNGTEVWRVPGFALNIGVKQSDGDYLILGNAEIYQVSEYTVALLSGTNSLAFPTVYDQPSREANLSEYKEWKVLNNLPFFMGVPRETFVDVGGYDEDFTGYCFEDADLVDRIKIVASEEVVQAEAIHLYNKRGVDSRGPNIHKKDWYYNKKLFEDRKGLMKRNTEKPWGIL